MSRAEKVHVNTEKIRNQLKKLGLTQQQLAENVGMNYIGVHRAIHEGRMTEQMLFAIGEEINAAPEDLQDLTNDMGDPDHVTFDWSFHLFQTVSVRSATEEFLKVVFINPDELTPKQFSKISARFWLLAQQIQKEYKEGAFEEIQ